MANKKEFGDRNKALSDKLLEEKIYYDWVITTAFYSSIHFVEDKILPLKISTTECKCIAEVKKAYKMNGRHEAREKLVFDNLGTVVGAKYRWLDDRSRYSRYETFKHQPAEGAKAQEYLNFIKKVCYPPAVKVTIEEL
ncbi:hypothetical protein [Flavobacterium poyangense]|uniref:hypothetical protein n=1 Tax=Flavobacterium poyangense TaxID=2204302 RepID=UPI00141E879F|nr:hypothetical protein [Flavobacterium sp. JXAS1]